MGAEAHFDVKENRHRQHDVRQQDIQRGLQSSSGDNTANLKSIQGVTCWVLDEAEELTDEGGV